MSRGASILLAVAAVLLFCGATTVTGFIGKEIVKSEADNGKFRITYELNGGINSENNPEYYRSEDGVQFEDPTYEGHVFTGWYSDRELTKRMDSIEKDSTDDVTVYAGWKISLVGKLLTYDITGNYTNTSTSADCTIDGLMTLEYLRKKGKGRR